jgi:tryptophan synthase alpha chain
MNSIQSVFRKPGRKALIAYVTAGYPDMQATMRAVPLLARCGCDIIELGIPFSDPMADGATIQGASHAALLGGVTPQQCLEAAEKLSREVSAPLVFMTYLNPVLSYGPERFCRSCASAGVGGLIIPDLPSDECGQLDGLMREQGIDLIQMVAPNSTPERLALATERARGFIYLVSMTGVTGAQNNFTGLGEYVASVRKVTSTPLCVGFGISTPEQAAAVAKYADGVIIGSRIVQLMKSDPTLASLEAFISQVRQKIDGC